MALLQGSLRTLLTAGLRGSDLMERLNAHLLDNIPSNRLVTLFVAELDPGDGTLRYVNAGHNPPFVMRADGPLARVTATGPALGVIPDARLETGELRLLPGDRLFAFTDGVTEAFDRSEQEYGEGRLEALLASRHDATLRALLDAVEADVVAFCQTTRFRDDMTMLVVAREG